MGNSLRESEKWYSIARSINQSEGVNIMDKEVKCPWCGEVVVPTVTVFSNKYGSIKERKCSKCGKVLAAYLEHEGDFLPEIRTF